MILVKNNGVSWKNNGVKASNDGVGNL